MTDHERHLYPQVVRGIFNHCGVLWLVLLARTLCQLYCALEFSRKVTKMHSSCDGAQVFCAQFCNCLSCLKF